MNKLSAAVDKLKAHGYKMTPQRRELLRVLSTAERHCSAQDVHRLIAERFPDVSLDTVYRNLRLLTELGLVNQVNLKSSEVGKYELDNEEAHHHHFVCLGCGRVISTDFCPLDNMRKAFTGSEQVRVVDHAFELYGYCADCAIDEGQ